MKKSFYSDSELNSDGVALLGAFDSFINKYSEKGYSHTDIKNVILKHIEHDEECQSELTHQCDEAPIAKYTYDSPNTDWVLDYLKDKIKSNPIISISDADFEKILVDFDNFTFKEKYEFSIYIIDNFINFEEIADDIKKLINTGEILKLHRMILNYIHFLHFYNKTTHNTLPENLKDFHKNICDNYTVPPWMLEI